MNIYLAGPINNCTDEECRGWREKAKALLVGHSCIDPMIRDYRGQENENIRSIVEDDKADIDSCWAVLAMCPRPSVGTSMEILYAWERHKAVYVIAKGNISPWLKYHSIAIFPALEDAVGMIG
jgi:nucleoside 2-deoxyribosyltransferase